MSRPNGYLHPSGGGTEWSDVMDDHEAAARGEGWTPCDTGDCIRTKPHDGPCSLGAECSLCESILRPEHMASHEVRHRFMGEGQPKWLEPGTEGPYRNPGAPQA